MCRALDPGDTEARVGRRTRCYNPNKQTARKNCTILVDSDFKTIVAQSYYFPSELEGKAEYNCANENPLTMSEFDGQGDDYTAETMTDHLVIGPLRQDHDWVVVCVDPLSLLPHNHPYPNAADTFAVHVVRRALPMLKHIPTEAEAQLILDRWMQQQRFICQSNEQNLFTACAVLRGMIAQGLCADSLFAPVQTIVDALDTSARRRSFGRMCFSMFRMGMYMRRWRGPGTPFPWEEDQTTRLVTAETVSASLIGQHDPETAVALDYVSTYDDGAVGVLTNCVRMNARLLMAYFEEDWLAADAMDALHNLPPVSTNVRALVPRHKKPRHVHTLLPFDRDSLISLVDQCVHGSYCIRMGSAKLVASSMLLYHSAFKTRGRDVPWSDEDVVSRLYLLANII